MHVILQGGNILITSINNFFNRILSIPYSVYFFCVIPVITTSGRIIEEEILFGFEGASPDLFLNYLVGYVLLQLMMTAVISWITSIDYKKIAGFATLGLLLSWLPALIDFVIPHQPGRRYMYFTEFRWNFASPEQLIGETIVLWFVIASIVVFVFWVTKSTARALVSLVSSYAVLQIYAWGWRALCLEIVSAGRFDPVEFMTLTGIILIFIVYLVLNYKSLMPSMKRINHSLPWGAVAMVGSRFIGEPWQTAIIKGVLMIVAFQFVIIANDYFDRESDSLQGGEARPVSSDDTVMAFFLMGLTAIWTLVFHGRAFFLMMMFYFLWTSYHAPGLRFKRIFGLNYLVEGFSALVCFLLGIMRFSIGSKTSFLETVRVDQFEGGSIMVLFAFFALGGFTLGSMIKDYKDIDQDKAAGISTVYTMGMQMGIGINAIHHTLSFLVIVMMLVPPVWLVLAGYASVPGFLLFLLAAVPPVSLLFIKKRLLAVELSIWGIGLYFFVLAAAVPFIYWLQ